MTIKISNLYSELTGIGAEYLVVDDNVICEFYDGMIIRGCEPIDAESETI